MLADHPPPRSWEQFEEFCADVFESAWADPALVRHGRAGQRQFGVDIVASHGALYPIGLQCKKRSAWPERKLSTNDIDTEIQNATGFTPPLKQFYILTTAPSDAALLQHVRAVNETHQKEGLFTVCLLGWDEIMRRAARDRSVMNKHFAPVGGEAPRSPLLATWFMSDGRLELTGDDLALGAAELSQDLHDWPTGHLVVRQRESDVLLAELRCYEDRDLTRNERQARIALRRKLRDLTDAEGLAVQVVTAMLTDPDLIVSLQSVYKPYERAHLAIESFLNEQLSSSPQYEPGDRLLRLSPPDDPDFQRYISARLSESDVLSLNTIMSKRFKRFGNFLTDTVAELPDQVLYRTAIPTIVRRLFDCVRSDGVNWDELRRTGTLNIGAWHVSLN